MHWGGVTKVSFLLGLLHPSLLTSQIKKIKKIVLGAWLQRLVLGSTQRTPPVRNSKEYFENAYAYIENAYDELEHAKKYI